jgi:hypothetical protein
VSQKKAKKKKKLVATEKTDLAGELLAVDIGSFSGIHDKVLTNPFSY